MSCYKYFDKVYSYDEEQYRYMASAKVSYKSPDGVNAYDVTCIYTMEDEDRIWVYVWILDDYIEDKYLTNPDSFFGYLTEECDTTGYSSGTFDSIEQIVEETKDNKQFQSLIRHFKPELETIFAENAKR